MIEDDRYILTNLLRRLEYFFDESEPDYNRYKDWFPFIIDMLSRDERNSSLVSLMRKRKEELDNGGIRTTTYHYPSLPYGFYKDIIYIVKVLADRICAERRDCAHVVGDFVCRLGESCAGLSLYDAALEGEDDYERVDKVADYLNHLIKEILKRDIEVERVLKPAIEKQKKEIESLKKEIELLRNK